VSPIWVASKFQAKKITPDDPKLDISTPPLGYFNYSEDEYSKAVYIERLPVRKWRQGLDADDGRNCNISCKGLKGNRFSIISARTIYSKGYEDLVLNEYPHLDVALSKLKSDRVSSIAINRDIALSKFEKIISVFYKRKEVGYMEIGSKVVKVPKEENSRIITKFLNEIAWEVQ